MNVPAKASIAVFWAASSVSELPEPDQFAPWIQFHRYTGWFLTLLAAVAQRSMAALSPGHGVAPVSVPGVEYVLEKTGTADPAAYPKEATMDSPEVKQVLKAATTASENVVQCVPSAGVPPLKWKSVDQYLVPPRYGIDVLIRREGVAATLPKPTTLAL
jgi:hypothetical protein